MLKYKYQISDRYRFLNICLKKRIVDLHSTVMPAQLSGPHCRASRISEAFAHAAIRSELPRPQLLLPVALSCICLTLLLTNLTQCTFQRGDSDS